MSKTRYGHTGVGGGDQDQGERKDEGWTSRQGGNESRKPGTKGEPEERRAETAADSHRDQRVPPPGTNTQGELAGIGEASREVAEGLEPETASGRDSTETSSRARDQRGAGTDQPPRMGRPLGPDPEHPHLPEGAQDTESRGSGEGGFDVGVNAKVVGAVHQGAREEDEPRA